MARRKATGDAHPEVVYERPSEHADDLARLTALRDKHYARNAPIDWHRPATATAAAPGRAA